MYKSPSPFKFQEEIKMSSSRKFVVFSWVYVFLCSILSGVYFFNPNSTVDEFPQFFAYLELASATFAFFAYALDRLGVLEAWGRGKNLFYIAILTFWFLTAPHLFIDSYRKIAEPHRDTVALIFLIILLIPCYWILLTRFLSNKKFWQFIFAVALTIITYFAIAHFSD